jgi:hypothetical protein
LWATELIPEPEDKYKLKLLQHTEGGADQATASDRQKKNKTNTTKQPGETMTELLPKYQHQDWMLEE